MDYINLAYERAPQTSRGKAKYIVGEKELFVEEATI